MSPETGSHEEPQMHEDKEDRPELEQPAIEDSRAEDVLAAEHLPPPPGDVENHPS